MEKNVNVCDICEAQLAKCKCNICDKDICEECKKEIGVGFLGLETGFGVNIANILTIELCKKCSNQLSKTCFSENIFEDIYKNKPEIKKEIIESIKNVMMLKKIDDEDMPTKKEKEIRRYPAYIPNYYPYQGIQTHYRKRSFWSRLKGRGTGGI